MKHPRWTRIASFLMAICLMMTLIPVSAMAAEEENETIDFVLLVDCSNTMDENDPDELARDACKLFVDLIPIEDARVSIIAFGYEGGKAYKYSNFKTGDSQFFTDPYFVHQIASLEGQLSSEKKDAVKRSIDGLGDVDGQLTPIGAALAAGVDVLVEGGATDGNACVILMSDGEVTSRETKYNNSMLDQAIAEGKSHEWPIYCIEMDYFNRNEASGSEARALLNRIVTESGAGADGRMKVSSPAEVAEAFMKIFASVWKSNTKVIPQKIDENGVVELEFEVPKLASEVTVAISSSDEDRLEKVELIHEASGYAESFTGPKEEPNLIVTKEDSYISVKMICPPSGTWKVRAYGDANAEIVWYEGIQMEMNLNMVANPSNGDPDAMTKNDYVEVQAQYTYNDTYVRNDDIYLTTEANLVVTNDNGVTNQFKMDATMDGYTYKLPVSAIPSGGFTVQVLVEHTMFRSGREISNGVHFHSENLPLEYAGGDTNRSGYVNNQFDRIDLNSVFKNPDGDPVTYDVYCTSDRSVTFEYTVDDQGYLYLNTGMVPGTYEMEITAADPDMAEPLTHTFTLTVEDRAIQATQIPGQELWVDYFEFLFIRQEPTNLELDIDLGQYFTDPDGVELTFGGVNNDTAFVDAQLNGTVLHLVPTGEGETSISFQVNDGVSTIDARFDVKVVSGVAVYWKENWIYWAACAALILAIILFFIFKHSATSAKGKWSIRLEYQNNTVSVDGAVDFSTMSASKNAKKKGKNFFRLKDAVNDCRMFFWDESTASNWLDEFFMVPGSEQIEMHGVFLGTGFTLAKIPASQDIKVEVGGRPVSGKNVKARVKADNVRIALSKVDAMNIRQTLSICIEPYVEGSSDFNY